MIDELTILFHRATPWRSDIRCSTKIFAEQFLKHGFFVTYLQGIVNPIKLIREKHRKALGNAPYREGHLQVLTPFSIFPYTRYLMSSKMADISYSCIVPSLKNKVNRNERNPDIVWTVPPGSSALKRCFPEAKLIMQVVDYYPAFLGERVKKIERNDYQRADHIFTVGHSLKKYLVEELDVNDTKVSVLGQGVENFRYKDKLTEPVELKNAKGNRFVYVGLLSKCDTSMMNEVVGHVVEVGGSLVLIGPIARWAEKMKASHPDQVFLLGPRNPVEIPAYLTNCDFGLMLYDQAKQEIYKGQHPLKLYEYAAAGLPVISTNHEEYEYINPPIECVNDSTEVRQKLKLIGEKKGRYAGLMKEFAFNHDWEKVYERAAAIIETIK